MPKSHSTTELRDWVAAAKGGDKEAFSELVTRFQDMAYGIAYAMLGEAGLAQEAFIAAYLNLSTLREPACLPRLVPPRGHQTQRPRKKKPQTEPSSR